MAQERRAPNRELTTIWKTAPGVRGILSSVDHKEIGLRYIITAFAFLIVGGLEALVMRIQLAHSGLKLLSPEAYDQLFTLHGFTMISFMLDRSYPDSAIISGRYCSALATWRFRV